MAHTDAWQVVQKHIEKELGFATVISMTEPGSAAINVKICKAVWHDCDCAVAILSADDQLVDGTINERPGSNLGSGAAHLLDASFATALARRGPVPVQVPESLQEVPCNRP